VHARTVFPPQTAQECQDALSFEITSSLYEVKYDVLDRKLTIYSSLFTFICAIQIYALVLQMRQSTNQAAASKISILCIGSQAVLDAAVCITHILASSAMVGVAFYHFMWISILKLLIFCLMEMRLIIAIYQGR
ncbi:FLY2, partial [Symbiodinium microadriaticum]